MAHAEMSSPEYHEDAEALAKLEQAWAHAAELATAQLLLRPLIGRTPTAAP